MNLKLGVGERPADLTVPVSNTDHIMGPETARYTVLEYGDYECPDCLNAQPIVAAVREELGDELRVVFRHFPLSSVHPHASAAAAAAEAAGAQGRFWEMHEMLFRYTRRLAEVDLTHVALRIGLEVYRFQRDLESSIVLARIRSDYAGGKQSGVTGTPTLFINERRFTGAIDVGSILEAIRAR